VTVHYERLSNLDASFLALETRTTHMHVGAVSIFSAGPSTGDEGVDIDVIRQLILSRLDAIRRYRQRLATVPIEGAAVWVDDEHFHLDYHVRHIALPHPGSTEQLKDLVGRLMSQQLDRSKPLWELYIVEGLEDGGFALIAKIHHCMIDGVSGIDLMAVLLDFAPEFEISEPKPWTARSAPNGTELIVREVSRTISSVVSGFLRAPSDIGEWTTSWSERARAAGASLSSGWLTQTDKTSLNGPISGARAFDWLQMPLFEIKNIKNEHAATVNDVMLAIVAGAVRRYLQDVGGLTQEDLEETEFRIMAPVSVRSQDESGTLGNKVAMWLLDLPIAEPDPAIRVQMVNRQTKRLKEADHALGASTLVEVSTGAPATLLSLAARLASRARPFNMTVTNVPGPQFPLYLAGSEMLATYPLVPLWQSHGAGIAMFSVRGMIDIGINMDRDLIPDATLLRGYLQDSLEELAAAAPPQMVKAKKRPPMGTK
jgi:WS/DGAT/MGAT family acyltransferase